MIILIFFLKLSVLLQKNRVNIFISNKGIILRDSSLYLRTQFYFELHQKVALDLKTDFFRINYNVGNLDLLYFYSSCNNYSYNIYEGFYISITLHAFLLFLSLETWLTGNNPLLALLIFTLYRQQQKKAYAVNKPYDSIVQNFFYE